MRSSTTSESRSAILRSGCRGLAAADAVPSGLADATCDEDGMGWSASDRKHSPEGLFDIGVSVKIHQRCVKEFVCNLPRERQLQSTDLTPALRLVYYSVTFLGHLL